MYADKTIHEMQSEIESALQHLPALTPQLPNALRPLAMLAPPKGKRAQVSLRHAKTDRQVKRNARADSWSPVDGRVSISYETSPAEEAHALEPQAAEPARSDALSQPAQAKDPAQDLVLALAKAERDPQLGFVSLKWFRDTYLPQRGYAWAIPPENRQRLLEDAINSRKWILTSKVPNPKNPQYPVTAIRVNRALADVRKILDQQADISSVFAPIAIRGENLSETVLRERR